MIGSAGWDYLRAYGDFGLNPVTFNTSRTIIVAKRH